MSLFVPENKHDLFRVTPHELFYASVEHNFTKSEENIRPGRKICMILWCRLSSNSGTLGLLVIDEDGTMSIRHPPNDRYARYWTFERYLTKEETVSISGSALAGLDSVPVASEVDGPDLPTHDQVRESKDLGLIPDGVYYRVLEERSAGHHVWHCVNCPPGKGKAHEIGVSSNKDKRSITLKKAEHTHTSWSPLNLITHAGWTFDGYIMPDDVLPEIKAYPKPQPT